MRLTELGANLEEKVVETKTGPPNPTADNLIDSTTPTWQAIPLSVADPGYIPNAEKSRRSKNSSIELTNSSVTLAVAVGPQQRPKAPKKEPKASKGLKVKLTHVAVNLD